MSDATLDWINCHMIRRPGSLIRQFSPPNRLIVATAAAATMASQSTIRVSRLRSRPAIAAQSSPPAKPTAEPWTSRHTVA